MDVLYWGDATAVGVAVMLAGFVLGRISAREDASVMHTICERCEAHERDTAYSA